MILCVEFLSWASSYVTVSLVPPSSFSLQSYQGSPSHTIHAESVQLLNPYSLQPFIKNLLQPLAV